jgi:hypothetical protein
MSFVSCVAAALLYQVSLECIVTNQRVQIRAECFEPMNPGGFPYSCCFASGAARARHWARHSGTALGLIEMILGLGLGAGPSGGVGFVLDDQAQVGEQGLQVVLQGDSAAIFSSQLLISCSIRVVELDLASKLVKQ